MSGSSNSSALAWTLKLYTVDTVNAINGRLSCQKRSYGAYASFFEEWNKGKAAAMALMDEFYAADFVLHSGTGEDIRGLKNRKQFASGFFDAFPDNHATIDDIVVEGDEIVIRYTFTGTHKGEYLGIPATNKKMTWWAIDIMPIASGKFVECWDRFDTLGLMQQLGVVPKPGTRK
jgi:steroid delta-isomerase-like uncharacterized protein